MVDKIEHQPGSPAPSAGSYEQLNIFGRAIGVRVSLAAGELLPAAPRGHTWTQTREAATIHEE
jgi:hypothetical protein